MRVEISIIAVVCCLITLMTLVPAAGAVVGATAEPAADQGPQPLTAESMWHLDRLSSPAVSPDGKWAVVTVTSYDLEEDKGTGVLWLLSTDGSAESRPFTSAPAGSAVWSPDGQWLAFAAKREGDDAAQIYVLPSTGGEARRVTKVPTGAGSPKWFPDSKSLAFVSTVWPDLDWEAAAEKLKEEKDRKTSAREWDKPWLRFWDSWIPADRQSHVYRVELPAAGAEPNEPTPITLGSGLRLSPLDNGGSAYDLAPDGKEIAFAVDVDDTGTDTRFDIFVMPVEPREGDEPLNVTADNPRGDDTGPVYSPDGRYLAFGRQTILGFYADRERLVVRDRKSGENRVATEAWDRSMGGLHWMPDGKTLVSDIDDAGTGRLYKVDVASGQPSALTGETTFGDPSLSADGRVLIALRESFLEPPTLVRVDTESGEATQLSHFNDERLAKIDFGTYESVTYKGANDDDIQMWINYPPGFDKSREYPLYLLIHGGPHNGVQNSFHWRWNAQLFSSWGYVTAWHNFHGSSGFGQEFTDSINPEQAKLPYVDTLKAAEYLAAKPFIDGDRMGAGGGSYGGYLASILLGREHPFKTLIAHAAVYNWYTQYGADYGHGQRRFGEAWEQEQVFRENSPHFGAGNFNTPTLVIHGQQDFRVPVNHGIELFNTLSNRGVKTKFVYFPDENHWILKPNNSIHWYDVNRDWLAEFLGGEGGEQSEE